MVKIKQEREERIEQILQNSFINQYLEQETITDINFDGVKLTLLDNKKGPIVPKEQPTLEEVRRLMTQITNVQGKQLNNSNPIMDTEIGYLRVNAVDDTVSPDGMTFSIRVSRPRLAITGIAEMTAGKVKEVEDLLNVLILAHGNIIISGETGTGKTELQKLLVNYIPDDELIVLIEDTRDSHIKALYPRKNIKSWQSLTSDEREKKVTIQDLVKAGLRNFPKWMLVSETRGAEAGDMLDSAKTGHSIITTLHATGAMDIPSRLMSMIRQSPSYSQVSDQIIGKEVTKFLRYGIHLEAHLEEQGIVRRIKEIVEFTDFTERGTVGKYLYRKKNVYNEKTGEYELVEEFGELSDETLSFIHDRKLYHFLPDVFKPKEKRKAVLV